MDYDFLRQHIGHDIVVACYGGEGEDPENIAIECETCNTVLTSCNKRYEDALECPECLDDEEHMTSKDSDEIEIYHCLECDYKCPLSEFE